MIQPPYLKIGDKIRIISSARKISKEELDPAINLLESWGLEVDFGKNLYATDQQFAGTEEQRARDLQDAIDNKEVKAILFARGGYGSVQIVDQVNWDALISNPKWLIGYSDITVFHCHLNQVLGLESIHATMPIDIKADSSKLSKEGVHSMKDAIFGNEMVYEFGNSEFNKYSDGEIEGELVGGNLSILYSLSGSRSQLSGKNKIIFMEDLDEYLYHIDRMMMNLLRSNLFEDCKAVIVGGMSDMNDNTIPFGKSAEEIISERLQDIGVPVFFGFPAGHIQDNRAMLFGRKVSITPTDRQLYELRIHGRSQ